jgi:hypothetical protein
MHGKNLPGMISLLVINILIVSACNLTGKISETSPASSIIQNELPSDIPRNPPVQTSPIIPSATMTREPDHTDPAVTSLTSTLIPTKAPSDTATITLLPSLTPTNTILRGTVLEQANCRYGPGAAYLYKYGLYAGYNLEIIGRNETGTWVVIQAIGGNNPCWVKTSLMDIHGEAMSLALISLPLPQSPYYGPLTGVSAVRNGTSVIISWNPLELRAGDDSQQYPYLVEAWLCQHGKLTFIPIGSWETIITVQDDPGCDDISHARVYGVEKHGYTAWVNIPWPQP